MRTFKIHVLTAALALALAATPAEASTRQWNAAWGTAAQPATAGTTWYGPNWSRDGFARRSPETVRQVVRVSAGGTSMRVSSPTCTAPPR
ncbi:hypothetical protein [Nonomuraea sp. B19D2]|uniref:hypothetical protein n=1 Tax=Nonomuraea sp. B19D2 TaxID=3159561 RepID=UPI0032DBCEB0